MKSTSFPFLLIAIVAVTLGFSRQHDPSIEAGDFEHQLRMATRRAGFSVVTEVVASRDEVALPLTVQWHPRRWLARPNPEALPSTADSAEHFGIVRDRISRVECFVRYLDGRAQCVAIRATSKEELTAIDLRLTLTQQFPGIPVRIEIQ